MSDAFKISPSSLLRAGGPQTIGPAGLICFMEYNESRNQPFPYLSATCLCHAGYVLTELSVPLGTLYPHISVYSLNIGVEMVTQV